VLTVKDKSFGDMEFWEEGQCVAVYEGGPETLFIESTEFSLSHLGNPEDVLKESGAGPILPIGSAHIGVLYDHHNEEIQLPPDYVGDMSGFLIQFGEDGPRYFKSRETELVAHFETPYDDTARTALAVNRRTYRAIRKRRRIAASRTIITEEDTPVAEVSHGFLSDRIHFYIDLSLRERIFITLMQSDWSYYREPPPTQEEIRRRYFRGKGFKKGHYYS
jgi:hypothetical protein